LLARSPRGLEPAAALALAQALGEVLAYLHGRGLVHGDLRPEHVLLSPRGEAKLIEFGSARAVGEAAAAAEEAADFGPPHDLAPEQLLGEPPDPRSDLFSLGVLSFQALTGARPFDAADPRGVTRRIRHDAPARLTSIAPAVPPSLERVVERCLEKNPDDRFPSAAALLEELAFVRHDLPAPADASALVQALARAGLGEPAPAPSPLAPSPRGAPAPARRAGVRAALVGQLVALGAMALGASVIQANARESPGADEASATLELVPDRAAALRVVARPWATVYVDGQFVDVTPFAKAVPLRAGTHHVHFRHPAAPDVQRVVTLAPGATALVEVEMGVPPPPPPPPASASAPAPADTTP
ncbi:MAG TPA: serine/threonine-protein kinase, partial [Polyangiaceae bacterium]|nr:serine/threonine-protein kinase [Polyangiaceae bacterium]